MGLGWAWASFTSLAGQAVTHLCGLRARPGLANPHAGRGLEFRPAQGCVYILCGVAGSRGHNFHK